MNVRQIADELIATIDRRSQALSLEDALDLLEELQGDLEARIDGLNDDIRNNEEAE